MNLDNLTIGEAKKLAAMFGSAVGQLTPSIPADHEPRQVVVCTDKRGVVFGTTTNIHADPITLTDARMCLRWSAAIGGVFGLAEKGPFDARKSGNTTISAPANSIVLKGVTAIFAVSPDAAKAWIAAPVAGR